MIIESVFVVKYFFEVFYKIFRIFSAILTKFFVPAKTTIFCGFPRKRPHDFVIHPNIFAAKSGAEAPLSHLFRLIYRAHKEGQAVYIVDGKEEGPIQLHLHHSNR